MYYEIPIIIFIVLLVLLLVRKLTFSVGERGEHAVAWRLGRLRRDQYFVINDLMIEKKNGHTTQIDHVVISPFGIFVIETKNFSGYIYGSENAYQWLKRWKGYARGGVYRESELSFDNPVLQNGSHVQALYELLHNQCTKFIPIIAFSPKATLKVNVPNVYVIYWTQVLDVIKRYKEEVMSAEQAKEIYNYLLTLNIKDKERRKAHAERAQIYKNNYKHKIP